MMLWTSTLGAKAGDYGGTLGPAVGFANNAAGTLDPEEYQYEPGSNAVFDRILWLTDNDRLYVRVNNEAASAVDGLWLKVSDHLAVQFGDPDGTIQPEDFAYWSFDVEGSLDWTADNDYEVSLWDKQPATTPVPPRQLWSASLGAASSNYGDLGSGVGYGNNKAGSLSPDSFLPSPTPSVCAGNSALFTRVVLLTDDADKLYVEVGSRDQLLCLVEAGLWLKVAEHLAFELGEPEEVGDNKWFFDIEEGSLGWTAGGSYVVSLWDKQPPLTAVPPLWTSRLEVGLVTDSGNFLGFVSDAGEGFLTPSQYEHEQGSSLTLDWFGYYPHNNRFWVIVLSGDPNGLNGLWIRIGQDLVLEMDAATRSGSDQQQRSWSLADGALDWSVGDGVVVTLWDQNPSP